MITGSSRINYIPIPKRLKRVQYSDILYKSKEYEMKYGL